jgi:hypothetical protein
LQKNLDTQKSPENGRNAAFFPTSPAKDDERAPLFAEKFKYRNLCATIFTFVSTTRAVSFSFFGKKRHVRAPGIHVE